MISRDQRTMLFGLWHRAKIILLARAGRDEGTALTKDEDDQLRKEFTATALGQEKSWGRLNSRDDVDRLKEKLLAILKPDDLGPQIDSAGQEKKRALWRVRELMRGLRRAGALDSKGSDADFLRGVIQQIDHGVDPNSDVAAWQREAERDGHRRDLEELSVPDLKKVMDALQSIARRRGTKTDTGDAGDGEEDPF